MIAVAHLPSKQWGAAKEGWSSNPPLPMVLLTLHPMIAPKHFEHKHRTFKGPSLEDFRRQVGGRPFWGVFGNVVLAKKPPRNPPSSLGRGVPRGVLGKNPAHPTPFL